MTSVCADLMQRDRVLDRGGRGSYTQMLKLFGYLGSVCKNVSFDEAGFQIR